MKSLQRLLLLSLGVIPGAALFAADAPSNPVTLNNTLIYEGSLAALTMLFVVALLLESAFATIFNWRVFLAYFSSRGIKTLIMIIASVIVVATFKIDTVASLVAIYKTEGKDYLPLAEKISGPFSMFITALILAGGSAGVNRLMVALGLRDKSSAADTPPTPPPSKAWIAVNVRRVKAVGPIQVKVRDLGPSSGVPNAPAPIAGTVGGQRPSLADILFRNPNRFPANGGYTLLPGNVYVITAEGLDAAGQPVSDLGGQYVFAPGAIVDFRAAL